MVSPGCTRQPPRMVEPPRSHSRRGACLPAPGEAAGGVVPGGPDPLGVQKSGVGVIIGRRTLPMAG